MGGEDLDIVGWVLGDRGRFCFVYIYIYIYMGAIGGESRNVCDGVKSERGLRDYVCCNGQSCLFYFQQRLIV